MRITVINNTGHAIVTDRPYRVVFGDGTFAAIDVGTLAAGKSSSLVCPQTWNAAPKVKSWSGHFHKP